MPDIRRRWCYRLFTLNDSQHRGSPHRDGRYFDAGKADAASLCCLRFAPEDGLHPNDKGYELMASVAQTAIDKALGK